MSGKASYRPKFGYDIRIHPEKRTARAAAVGRRCAMPGCLEAAEFRVPKNRDNLEDRHWLCRDHVRQHNASWDYFAGMSDTEIESHCLDALTGHRPTWPLGKRAAEKGKPDSRSSWGFHFDDGFAVFEDAAEPAHKPKAQPRLTKGQLDALAILGFEETPKADEIKARYKELVKRFHPDANGGDRSTEERLKQVIKAYKHLRATNMA